MRSFLAICLATAILTASAWGTSSSRSDDLSPSLQRAIDRVIAREASLLKQLSTYRPLAESYVQDLRTDAELGLVPISDQYFLAQLDLRHGLNAHSFMKPPRKGVRVLESFTDVTGARLQQLGLVQPIFVDSRGLDRKHYEFNFVRREFLGEVRTLVFDVTPRTHDTGRFVGRIWVEDQDYTIVRFNGTYQGTPLFSRYLHFDSWRLNVQPGLWLPAYIYFEESGMPYSFGRKLRLKGETRFWGYGLTASATRDEFTNMVVDTAVDQSQTEQDRSPVQQQRAWEREAEDNVIERLQKAGLIAPPGEVNKILETVVNNLEVTNKLDIEPQVRARVLLTSQLESFTIGHTIVLSRGLIDVLPDEASLAMVLAHELAHIALGHSLDTKYAFDDRMLFANYESFRRIQLSRKPSEEDAADVKAMALLKASPYADKLGNAGLFLRALAREAPQLTNLVSPHLGNRLVKGRELLRLADLMRSAPDLKLNEVNQISALPLGSRIYEDPWDAHIRMLKARAVPLLSVREKMPFEITPVMLNLTRTTPPVQQKTESTAAATKGKQ